MSNSDAEQLKDRLIEAGARFSQDLGLGRITGQMLIYLYLTEGACSLDEIGKELGLSKASSSIAARQLERLGMVVRVWKKGDRKSYYQTADNFVAALQRGMLEFVRQKLNTIGSEIEYANSMLEDLDNTEKDEATLFIEKRVARAMKLKKKVEIIMKNPLIKTIQPS